MIEVDQAQELILQHCQPLPGERTRLSPAVLGRVLAEDVTSDIDMPPFDKAMMDGYALRSADLPSGTRGLRVIEEVCAGQIPRQSVGVGQATRIMTGSPLPPGADTVVMVERTRQEGDTLHVDGAVAPGQHVMHRAREVRKGDVVLVAGAILRPQSLGLLAAAGLTSAVLYPRATMALVSTGDELVEAGEALGEGQIRNGNGPMLAAQAVRDTQSCTYLGIARDSADSLDRAFRSGLRASVLVISGGVSAGRRDLVPDTLAGLDVMARFHKVSMKPGKPVFFGTRDSGLVFGLPGNPVSAFVCFELFVRPALRALAGWRQPRPRVVAAPLSANFIHRSDRPTYHPASFDGRTVTLSTWLGSADLRSLGASNSLGVLPAGELTLKAGEMIDVLPMDAVE